VRKEKEKESKKEDNALPAIVKASSEISRRRTAAAAPAEDDLFSLSEYTRCAIRNAPSPSPSPLPFPGYRRYHVRESARRIQLRGEKGTGVLVCTRVKARSQVGGCLRTAD